MGSTEEGFELPTIEEAQERLDEALNGEIKSSKLQNLSIEDRQLREVLGVGLRG